MDEKTIEENSTIQNYFVRSTIVSEILPIAKSSLFKIVHDSRIDSVVVDNQYYVKIADLLEFVREHNVVPLKDFLNIDKNALENKKGNCITEQDIFAALPDNVKTKTTILLWIKRMKPVLVANAEEKNCFEKENLIQIINKLLHQKEKEYQKFLNGFSAIKKIVKDNDQLLIYQMSSPYSEQNYCVELTTPKIIEQE